MTRSTEGRRRERRQEYGDWQTPSGLAEAVLALIQGEKPAVVLEPTCGQGAFLVAAARRFPEAALHGYEINPEYVNTARSSVPAARSVVHGCDFFRVAWEEELGRLPGPLLITGNPPWVTSAELGAMASANLPPKHNWKSLRGYDALTGKSNFDVSEWMLLRLLLGLQGRHATIAVICKSAVARRVIEFAWRQSWPLAPGGLHRIDALRHFGASVDAVVLVARTGGAFDPEARWPVHPALGDADVSSWLGVVGGAVVPDLERHLRTAHLAGPSPGLEWRSGVKHDCARVMELRRDGPDGPDGTRLVNGLGETVDIEDELVFPLLKSSDLANGRLTPSRALIVTQRSLGEDTRGIAARAPKAWSYLERHRELLVARRSAIHRGKPPFSIFGVGSYSFAPWKVAVSGLYKRFAFGLVGPSSGRPVMLDDTCYFLPFEDEDGARRAIAALDSPAAREFLSARVFWDAKRPINKTLLQSLDLGALARGA